MKKIIASVLISIILISLIMPWTKISYAEEVSQEEKTKIQNFLNEKENLQFGFHKYSNPEDIILTEELGIPNSIANKYGKKINQAKGTLEDEEANYIIDENKAATFTLENANQFMMEKTGIKFEDMTYFSLYQQLTTTSTNPNLFYHIVDGYPDEDMQYNVQSTEILENGNIKVNVKLIATDETYNNTIVLKPNGDSYLFVSCNNPTEDYYDFGDRYENKMKEAIQNKNLRVFINVYKLFSFYNYTDVRNIPIQDEGGIPDYIPGHLLNKENEAKAKEALGEEYVDFKIKYFTKTDADEFLMSILGIKFDDLKEYDEYENEHTAKTDKTTYYKVAEGYGTDWRNCKNN